MPYLYDELVRYCGSDAYPFHMPGHKRRLGQLNDPFSFDITEIDGFDNLHHAEGILLEAEKRAARLYGAEETHFLVNGSTAGILSAIGAVTTAGGHLLMMRASHKAAYHAVAAGGLTAHYLSGLCGGSAPHIRLVGGFGKRTSSDGAEPGRSQADGLTELDCGQPADPAEVERALAEDPRIQAVYITSPTYDGIVSDVRAIAEIAHRHGIPLIVDEAHGAHFGMHEIFPESSVKLGADLVIHSVHKTLPSLTQTALIHVQGKLVYRRRLREMLDIYQTSSPSYVLMASIDQCIRMLESQGKELFDRLAENLRWFYTAVADLSSISCIVTDDPSKILLRPAGHEAGELYDALRQTWHLQPEMLSRSYVLMLSSIGDDEEGFRRLSEALHQIDRSWSTAGSPPTVGKATMPEGDRRKPVGIGEQEEQEALSAVTGPEASREMAGSADRPAEHARGSFPEAVMTIRKAQDSAQERVLFAEAAGRVSGEYLYLYPPGIPLITPGERIPNDLSVRVWDLMAAGYAVEGTDDYSLRSVWCVGQQEEGEKPERP
jgi:arginine/lysine/ornithine decarboxylase